VAVAIGLGTLAARGPSGPGLVGSAVVVAAIGGWVLAMRRVRRGGVLVEPGRIGRVGGGGATRWCELDDVSLATVHEYGVVFGGRQQNLVLWTAGSGDRGLTARFARAGMSADHRRALAAAESAAGTRLAPFVVELSDLPEGAGTAILHHVQHLR
jgi:hypothetical protein